MAAALRLLLGRASFWVEARVGEHGTRTEINELPGTTPTEARAAFALLPQVITLRAMAELEAAAAALGGPQGDRRR